MPNLPSGNLYQQSIILDDEQDKWCHTITNPRKYEYNNTHITSLYYIQLVMFEAHPFNHTPL